MLERIKHALKRRTTASPVIDPVVHWATQRVLSHHTPAPGQFEIEGLLLRRPFRAECGESSRPYILGQELRARLDLGLPHAGHVIVMSRVVRQALEKQANALYADAVDSVRTRGQVLPEEVRWLGLFRQGIWAGPHPLFWERYAVLSDSADLAKQWLDNEAVDGLLTGTNEGVVTPPLLVTLMRGKCSLRVQVNPQAHGADALQALNTLEHLGASALRLAGHTAGGH